MGKAFLLSFVLSYQLSQFRKLLFHAVHLFVVMVPDFTAPYRLTLCHLSCSDNFIHKVSKQPHAEKTHRYDNDQEFPQARDAEEDHKLITRRDDKKREVENDEK